MIGEYAQKNTLLRADEYRENCTLCTKIEKIVDEACGEIIKYSRLSDFSGRPVWGRRADRLR